MKNRFLRFTFVVFLSGLTSVLMALTVDGDQNQTIDKSKRITSQEYLSLIRNNQETGTVSISDVIRAQQASLSFVNNKSAKSTYQWTSMGPNNMAGPTKAVIFDNKDESGNTLYAASTNGGVWKTTNYGNTWSKVETSSEVLNVSSITQADNGTIYIGTGVSLEPAADKISEGSTIGKGIWFANGNDSFTLMPGTAPSGSDVEGDWAFIQKLAVNGSGLYAATNTGLKFYDGTNWTYAQSEGVDLMGKSCDVVSDGSTTVTVVAGKTYVSTAGSTAFVLKSGEEDDMLPIGNFGNIKFAISQANPDYIYASYVTIDGALHNVYVSTDKGNTWRVVYPGGSSIDDIFNGQGLRNNAISVNPDNEKTVFLGAYNVFAGYEAQPSGYYSWLQLTNGNDNPFPSMGTSNYVHFGINSLVFNPANHNHVIVASDGGLSISKDLFSSTQLLNRGYNTSEYFTINASKAGTIVAGAQFNGVHKIMDNGANQAIELLSFNTPSAPSSKTGGYNHISFINPDFYVCSAEDGTFWRSEDAGENKSADILSGVAPGAEFITPFLLWETPETPFPYDTVEFKAFRDYAAGENIWASSNNYDFPFKVTLEQKLDSGDTKYLLDQVAARAFIAVEGEASSSSFNGGVYMTTGMLDYTAAPTWWQIGAVEGIPTCMAYSKDANYLWVGTLEGRLFRLSNIARAHSFETADIDSPGCIIAITEIALSTTQAITSISVDPQNADNVLFTLGNYGNDNYIFATTQGLNDVPTFNSIQGNLPKMPVYASTFEVNNDGLVFIGTENGLFYTNDFTAATWVYEDAGFGNVPVFALKQQNINWPSIGYSIGNTYISFPGAENYGAIYVGTFGAGAYVSKDFVGFEEFEDANHSISELSVYPNPANNKVHLAFESQKQSTVLVGIYDLSGKLVIQKEFESQNGRSIIDLNVNNIENGSYIIMIHDGDKQLQSKLIISK